MIERVFVSATAVRIRSKPEYYTMAGAYE